MSKETTQESLSLNQNDVFQVAREYWLSYAIQEKDLAELGRLQFSEEPHQIQTQLVDSFKKLQNEFYQQGILPSIKDFWDLLQGSVPGLAALDIHFVERDVVSLMGELLQKQTFHSVAELVKGAQLLAERRRLVALSADERISTIDSYAAHFVTHINREGSSDGEQVHQENSLVIGFSQEYLSGGKVDPSRKLKYADAAFLITILDHELGHVFDLQAVSAGQEKLQSLLSELRQQKRSSQVFRELGLDRSSDVQKAKMATLCEGVASYLEKWIEAASRGRNVSKMLESKTRLSMWQQMNIRLRRVFGGI